MKWRVLVADDEPVILGGIRKFVEESGCGCEVVGMAADGEEAIAMIMEKKPHIVVSDIQMPRATGLDMIRKFYKEKNCPKFIFISGYDEFDYVKAAIRYDAVDYLLKPVSRGALEEVLCKSIQQLTDENKLNLFKEDKTEIQSFFETIYQDSAFEETEMYGRFRELGMDCGGKFMVATGFGLSFPEGSPMSYEQQELLRFVVYDEIYTAYKELKSGFLVQKDDEMCYLILMLPEERRYDFVMEYVRRIKAEIEERHGITLRVCIGDVIDSVSQLQHAFKTVRFARELYFFDEKDLIDYQNIHQNFTKSFEDYEASVQEVQRCLTAEKEQLMRCVGNVLDIIVQMHYGNRYVAVNRCAVFLEDVCIYLREYNLLTEELQDRKNDALQQIAGAKVYREVRVCVLRYFDVLAEALKEDGRLHAKKEIMKVTAYMKEHYSEDITLKALADLIGMNPAYFSVYFQKNVGENYKTYLTHIRMQEAHKLVMGTDMLTYEIAENVGYRTVRRFTEAFRKEYGMNPMEYKKNQ